MANGLEWFTKKFVEIAPDVEKKVVFWVLAGMITAFHWLIAGLPLWRHIIADFLLAVLMTVIVILAWQLIKARRVITPLPANTATGGQESIDPYAGVLSPLQLDTLKLSKQMRDFYAEIKPDWSATQVMHGYAGRFNSDLTSIMHRLGAANVGVGFLEVYTRAITNSPSILDAARLLEKLALTLNEATVS